MDMQNKSLRIEIMCEVLEINKSRMVQKRFKDFW